MQLADVIAQVESGTRDEAVRFEISLFGAWGMPARSPGEQRARDQITATIAAIHHCNRDTAHMIACTSWGRYQILGENIYSLCECKLPVTAFAIDPDFQRICLEEFLRKRGIDMPLEDILADEGKRSLFISRYNGPDNVADYRAKMQAAIKALGG